MQVKQRLKINAAASMVTALIILLVFSFALHRLNKANNLAKISGDIILNSFERLTLGNDYLQNQNERAKTQWFARHEAVGRILKSASKEFQAPEDKEILDEMLKKNESIGKNFSAIVGNREKNESTLNDTNISQEVEDRLLSQLNIKVYEVVVLGRELLESSRKARASTIRLTGMGITCLLLVLLSAVIINSWTMGRAITERVRRLCSGALVIGEGNLDHQIDVKGDDEFAELADAFNAMAPKLKTTYHALETEVEERKKAEEALRESEVRYRSIFEGSNDGIIAYDLTTGKFVFANKRMHELLGYTGEEILTLDIKDIHPPKDLPYVLKEFNEMATGGKTYTSLIPVLRKDGSIIYCDIGSSFLGKTTLIGFFRDVTERKQAEEALRQSREDLSRAQEVGNIGSWRLDVRRNVLAWSDENHYIFGIPKGTTMTYETFLGAVHPDDRTYVDIQWKAGLRGQPYDIEHRIVVNGLVKWVREKAYLEFDKDGSLLGGFGITQDITKRKQTEEELRIVNEELGTLVKDRTRLYSVLAEINGAIVRVHTPQTLFEEVCRILVKAGSFRLAWVGILDPESREIRPVASFGESTYLEGINIIAADVPEGKGPTGRAVYEDHYVINTDFEKDPNLLPWRERARSRSLRSSSSFPLHESGQVIGAITIYSDKPTSFAEEEVALLFSLAENISFALDSIRSEMLRTAAEDNLRSLNEELEARVQRRTAELEAVNKELEAFSYTISHDLKAPLRSIQGFAKAIIEDYGDSLDATGRDYLLRINSAGERMTQLIEAMMEMSRLTSRDLMEKTVNLSSIAEVIAYELKKKEPDRTVEFLIAKEVKALGDSALLEVVLRNLLDNAFKFTSGHDSAKIEFGVIRMDGENVYFVRDDGAGFDMRYAGKLFQPFQRFHAESEFRGIGIGLAIVWKIIVKHGGKIWAESKIGEGATFYFTLE